MSRIWVFTVLWGVWLLTPALVDGVDALLRLAIVWRSRHRQAHPTEVEDGMLPSVSVIVPAHNEAAVIDRCLNSLKAQDYPHDRLEVIVVDDGSTDDTADRVSEHINGTNGNGKCKMPDGTTANGNGSLTIRGQPIRVGEFQGTLALITNGHQGKAHALNAGIEASSGEIVVNVDSDVVLAPETIRRTAESFVANPKLGAATGNIHIDWELIEARDDGGHVLLDDAGNIIPRSLGPFERFLAKCQFLEYLASFRLGRHAQGTTRTMYTLAGAYAAFRRSTLEAGALYSNRTVSEDTDLTLDLHRQKCDIGYLAHADVFVEPVVEWDDIYAQRVRWTRGQLEVCGLHEEMLDGRLHGMLGFFTLPQMLLQDHTLAFPRLIWSPLLVVFPMFGYSWSVIVKAFMAIYAFYVAIELVNTLVCYSIVDAHTKTRVERCAWAILGMPIYRFAIFHFRFSGFLIVLKEPQRWSMPGPWDRTRRGLQSFRLRSIRFASMLLTGSGPVLRFAETTKALVLPASIALLRVFQTKRTS